MKKLIVLFAGVVLLLAQVAVAAEFIGPAKGDGNVSVTASNQPHRNVYAAGGNVNVNTEVLGDLYVAGGVVNVASRVEEDLNAAGGTVIVGGVVGGDARLGGGNVSVNSPVTGDLLAGAGNLNLSSSAVIGGDLIVGSGNVSVDGPVAGKVVISGDQVRINSVVVGEVKVYGGSLTFGPQARVSGSITYKGPKEAVVEDGAVVSTINYEKVTGGHKGKKIGKAFGAGSIIQLIATFIVAIVIAWYRRNRVLSIMSLSSQNPLSSLGIGVLALIVTPIVTGIILITIIGYYLAFLVGLSFVFLIACAWALSSVYLGSLLMQWYRKTPEMELNWKTILLGVIVFRIILWIPIAGWIVAFLFFLVTLGSIIRLLKPVKVSLEIDPKPTL